MAIPKNRKNKFDEVAEELNREEENVSKKSEAVVKDIAGKRVTTKIIHDKNGRDREVRVVEKRKTFPVYIPESLYSQFDEITTAYGISKNAAICQMVRDYVNDKKKIIS